MKVKSKIDEVVCTGVTITGGPSIIINAEFGYLADGFPCGQVEVVNLIDDDVGEKARDLLNALEEFLGSKIGESDEGETETLEPKGLIPREF